MADESGSAYSLFTSESESQPDTDPNECPKWTSKKLTVSAAYNLLTFGFLRQCSTDQNVYLKNISDVTWNYISGAIFVLLSFAFVNLSMGPHSHYSPGVYKSLIRP